MVLRKQPNLLHSTQLKLNGLETSCEENLTAELPFDYLHSSSSNKNVSGQWHGLIQLQHISFEMKQLLWRLKCRLAAAGRSLSSAEISRLENNGAGHWLETLKQAMGIESFGAKLRSDQTEGQKPSCLGFFQPFWENYLSFMPAAHLPFWNILYFVFASCGTTPFILTLHLMSYLCSPACSDPHVTYILCTSQVLSVAAMLREGIMGWAVTWHSAKPLNHTCHPCYLHLLLFQLWQFFLFFSLSLCFLPLVSTPPHPPPPPLLFKPSSSSSSFWPLALFILPHSCTPSPLSCDQKLCSVDAAGSFML